MAAGRKIEDEREARVCLRAAQGENLRHWGYLARVHGMHCGRLRRSRRLVAWLLAPNACRGPSKARSSKSATTSTRTPSFG